MDLLYRLAALLALATLLCVTGCDRGSRGTGNPDGPVRVQVQLHKIIWGAEAQGV